MRTTINIDDDLLRRLKREAVDQGRTLQDVTNDLLRQALARRAGAPYKLKLSGWKAKPQPGVDVTDRDKLFDLMNGR